MKGSRKSSPPANGPVSQAVEKKRAFPVSTFVSRSKAVTPSKSTGKNPGKVMPTEADRRSGTWNVSARNNSKKVK